MADSKDWIAGPFGLWWVGAGPRPATTPDMPPPPVATPPPFVPRFRSVVGNDAFGYTWQPNKYYFADHATAEWIAKKYGDGVIYEQPILGPGPFSLSENAYVTMIDGRFVNTGILASYYDRNPPDLFPGVADSLIRAQLAVK